MMKTSIMLAAGVLLPAIGVAPQLQARALGQEYVVRVAPVDPIDPYRGAYVALDYPDLTPSDATQRRLEKGRRGEVFLSLRRDGEVWVADGYHRTRPDAGPYLACSDRDWEVRCGIESLFLPAGKARALEREVAQGGALARLKVDSRGHAAVVGIE